MATSAYSADEPVKKNRKPMLCLRGLRKGTPPFVKLSQTIWSKLPNERYQMISDVFTWKIVGNTSL